MKTAHVLLQILGFLTLMLGVLRVDAFAQNKPNILHIHADDHRADGLRALGNKVLHTPNLDALVERGTSFRHCYTMGSMSGAVCQPSRTMMLTGRSWLRIPPAKTPMKDLDASTFMPRVLGAAGYQTVHVGKGGNEFTPGLQSFDQNITMNDHAPDQRRGSSERHADAVIRFLDDREKDRPFYVYLAPPVPHDPRVAAPEFMDKYVPNDVVLSPAFMPVHPFDNGEMTVRDEQLAPWPRTVPDTKRQTAEYYACITGLDHHVGRIIERLRKEGQLENTIVVFSGDNGLSLGEHGLFGKQNLYEFGGMHVPLVIAGPGIPKGKSDALVYLMDLFPTFSEFVGARTPECVEGQSLVPLINGTQLKVRDVLYTAYKTCQRAVRDQRWKLIRYPLVNVTQLFDLSVDPLELENLAERPEYSAKAKEMALLLEQEMIRYGDGAPLVVPDPAPAKWAPPAKGESAKQSGV
jgi:arylsulfatase A-like enzyme